METLVSEPEVAEEAADETPTPVAPGPTRACATCDAALERDQEWCLECGNAQPGRLSLWGAREGMRAAAAIIGAVAILAGGAAAAAYAALSDDSQQAAVSNPEPSIAPMIAVKPPETVTTPAPVQPQTLPTMTTPTVPEATSTPTPPPAPAPPPVPTPAPTPAPDTTDTTQTTPQEEQTPESTPGLQEVELGPDAAIVYDPYKRATDQTDPADSYDTDPETSFTINTAADQPQMAVGLDYDLEQAREVAAIEIHTSTPGFRVEVYGAEKGLPPDILDSRWKHLTDKSDVGVKKKKDEEEGVSTIEFKPGKYRHVLLWITTPPTAGPAVAISEVRLLD